MMFDPVTGHELMATVDYTFQLATGDHDSLVESATHYGDSWKKRGGPGAFMMLARKWDRLELQVQKYNYDVFAAIENDKRAEGILDDIRDLRRYLLLVEAEMVARGVSVAETKKSGSTKPSNGNV